jgi:tetratricopeptide (TPR) repeat protein
MNAIYLRRRLKVVLPEAAMVPDGSGGTPLNVLATLQKNLESFGFLLSDEVDRAISDYDQAIRINPKYAHAYGGRGGAYENKGDYARALADYDQSLRLNPNDTNVRQARERTQAALAARPDPVSSPVSPPVPHGLGRRSESSRHGTESGTEATRNSKYGCSCALAPLRIL